MSSEPVADDVRIRERENKTTGNGYRTTGVGTRDEGGRQRALGENEPASTFIYVVFSTTGVGGEHRRTGADCLPTCQNSARSKGFEDIGAENLPDLENDILLLDRSDATSPDGPQSQRKRPHSAPDFATKLSSQWHVEIRLDLYLVRKIYSYAVGYLK